jgi:hypothetical protein
MKTEDILRGWQLNVGASEDAICDAVSSIGCSLPSDYMQFLRDYDGGEGFIGDNYVILWKAEELNVFNREYEVEQYAPGLLLIGSNGGGEGYGFDMRDSTLPVIRIPFIGMELRYVRVVGSGFTDFLNRLVK